MDSDSFFKRMGIYALHRSDLLDHKNGRPAILLKYKNIASLVWFGKQNLDTKNLETPLILKINDFETYFYSSGISWVDTNYLTNKWVNQSNNTHCELNEKNQQNIIKKFVSFTSLNDPYIELNRVKKVFNKIFDFNLTVKTQNRNLKNVNLSLKKTNEKLKRKLNQEKNQENEIEK